MASAAEVRPSALPRVVMLPSRRPCSTRYLTRSAEGGEVPPDDGVGLAVLDGRLGGGVDHHAPPVQRGPVGQRHLEQQPHGLAGVGRLGGDPRGLVRPARRVPAQRREEQGVLVTEGVVQAAPADAFGAKSRGCGRRQVDPAPKNGVSRTG
jgi:hypothetical protein